MDPKKRVFPYVLRTIFGSDYYVPRNRKKQVCDGKMDCCAWGVADRAFFPKVW